MNVGLPGTGIGGVFYLLSALWMPFHEIYRTIREKKPPQRVHLILAQVSLALGIIAGIWLMGWLLGELLATTREWLSSQPDGAVNKTSALPNVIKMTMVFLTIGLLASVVGGVHILKLVMRYRQPRRALDLRVNSPTAFNSQVPLGDISNTRDAMAEKAVSQVAP
jgi:hypothetical protein